MVVDSVVASVTVVVGGVDRIVGMTRLEMDRPEEE